MRIGKESEICDNCGHIYPYSTNEQKCHICGYNRNTTWETIKRWVRYHIGHRTLGGPVKIGDIPYKEK